jgi:hypothetical protein
MRTKTGAKSDAILKMETSGSSEMLVKISKIIKVHIPEKEWVNFNSKRLFSRDGRWYL